MQGTTLRPVHPNAGLAAAYRKKLEALVREMSDSVIYWLKAAYRADPPRAQDETPAEIMRKAIRDLARQWNKRFDDAAPRLAQWFGQSAEKRSQAALRSILKDAGFSVAFTMTPAMRDVVDVTINQNVALIKSIPAQYFTDVEGLVMRSVQNGRDLGFLTSELEARYGITHRRAAIIARDQNNKATASMTRARHMELGLDEAVWVHSGAGKHPRPTHVRAGRERTHYRISEGWYDPALKRFIQPGEEPNCRCIGRPIIKGFS